MPDEPIRSYLEAGAAEAGPLKVVAVLGTSFSGSTLLNLILGAHPDIYAGGEMIGLLAHRDQPGAGSCTSCGLDCSYWGEANRALASKDNLYPLTRRIFAKDIIVDTSKSVEWFRDLLQRHGNRIATPVFVLVVKHPIRYLASCVGNIQAKRPRGWLGTLLARVNPAWAREAFLAEHAKDLIDYYRAFFDGYGRAIGGSAFHLLHYERLVDDPRKALTPLLASLGLAYDEQMNNFWTVEHHQIGGNNGTLFQLHRSWQGAESDIPDYRRAFYENQRGLHIDDKYLQTFSDRELSRLRANPAISNLAERLGYLSPDMPFRI